MRHPPPGFAPLPPSPGMPPIAPYAAPRRPAPSAPMAATASRPTIPPVPVRPLPRRAGSPTARIPLVVEFLWILSFYVPIRRQVFGVKFGRAKWHFFCNHFAVYPNLSI